MKASTSPPRRQPGLAVTVTAGSVKVAGNVEILMVRNFMKAGVPVEQRITYNRGNGRVMQVISSAGKASSTTINRFKVEVVMTTIAPRQSCTRPMRKIENHDNFTAKPPSFAGRKR
mgnify:CR=1 FL=1